MFLLKIFDKSIKSSIRILIIALFSMLILENCTEAVEGCLDPDGTNFSPGADVSCCCEYPLLKLKVNHKADSLGFSFSETYLDAANQPFIINTAHFYLSNFLLVRADGSTVNVDDTLIISYQNNDTEVVTDDYTLLSPNVFQADLGNLTTLGDFTKLRFFVGIPSITNLAVAGNMPSGHDLGIQNPAMHFNTDSGYIFSRFEVVKDTSTSISTTYEVWDDPNLVVVELDYPITVKRGTDVTLTLDINYLNFVEGVNWQTDDMNTVLSKIVSNTATVFSVAE